MSQDLFIVAIDLGGYTVPALLTCPEERWRADRPRTVEPPPAEAPPAPAAPAGA